MGYGTDSIAADSYFLNAYNSPNLQQIQYLQALQQQQQQRAVPQTNAVDTSALLGNNTAFKGADKLTTDDLAQEEKSSSNAGWWLLGAAAVIAGGVICYKKGDGKGLEKIIDGAKKLFSRSKDTVADVIGKNKSVPKEFTVSDQNICTVPNRTNFIRKSGAADELTKIASTADAPTLTRMVDGKPVLEKGVQLRDYTFTDNGNIFRVRKGKLVSYTNSAGENVIARYKAPVETTDVNYKKTINEMISKFNKGEELNKLSNIKFSHSEDGTSRLFSMAKFGEVPQLQCAASNRFHVSSDAVTAYRAKNEPVDKLLKAVAEGKKDGLNIARADYVSPSIGTFKIENGDIAGIIVDGKYHLNGSDPFVSLQYKNKEAFDNVLKHPEGFTNIVYKV